MIKKIHLAALLFGFFMGNESSAMNESSDKHEMPPPPPPKKGMNKDDIENASKMLLLKEHMKNQDAKHPDVHGYLGKTLHAVSSNPVLDSELQFTNPRTKEKISFKIGTKVKDGMIDLSDKAFGNVANRLVITTDPNVFLATTHENKIVILLATWSLIHDNLKTSTAIFEPIIKNWDPKKAPIGIFWRKGNDAPEINFVFAVTHLSVSEINAKENVMAWIDTWGNQINYSLQILRNVRDTLNDFTIHFDKK